MVIEAEVKSNFQFKIEAGIVSFFAEIFGSAILMFVGCSGVIGDVKTVLIPSLTFGIGVLIATELFGKISGAHINPALSIGVLFLGKITIFECIYYVLGQFVGTFMGYSLLYVASPSNTSVCVLELNENISTTQGFFLQTITPAILMMSLAGFLDERNKSSENSLKASLVVVGLVLAIGPFTGTSLNPALALPPSVFFNNFDNHWIYHVGPVLGCIIGAVLYRYVFDSKEDKKLPTKLTVFLCYLLGKLHTMNK